MIIRVSGYLWHKSRTAPTFGKKQGEEGDLWGKTSVIDYTYGTG